MKSVKVATPLELVDDFPNKGRRNFLLASSSLLASLLFLALLKNEWVTRRDH